MVQSQIDISKVAYIIFFQIRIYLTENGFFKTFSYHWKNRNWSVIRWVDFWVSFEIGVTLVLFQPLGMISEEITKLKIRQCQGRRYACKWQLRKAS